MSDQRGELVLQQRERWIVVEARRRDGGAQHRGLDGPREQHRTAAAAHEPDRGRIRQHEASSRRGERLVERQRHDHARVPAEIVEGGAAAMRSRPARRVGIVDVEVQRGIRIEERAQLGERREVTAHRVQAVAHVEDAPSRRRQLGDALLEPVQVIVAHPLDGDVAKQRRRRVEARVRELIDQHGIALADEHGQRRDVAKGRRRRDEHVPACHRRQLLLELAVERVLEVGARERKLRAVTPRRLAGAFLEIVAHLEPQVAAGPEVAHRTAVDLDRRAVVMAGAVHDDARVGGLADEAVRRVDDARGREAEARTIHGAPPH